ncbi:hypothetical protein XaC1_517 [Xanthomonas phage XaC1]|nr:hypothetical protein XaC1_517 [Xanthomonas phage XaC1]
MKLAELIDVVKQNPGRDLIFKVQPKQSLEVGPGYTNFKINYSHCILVLSRIQHGESYSKNHVEINSPVIVGLFSLPLEQNKHISNKDMDNLKSNFLEKDGTFSTVMFITNDEFCSGIELLHVCEPDTCGIE